MKDRNGDEILVGSRVQVDAPARRRNGIYMPGSKYRGFVVAIQKDYLEVDINGKIRYARPEYAKTVRVAKQVRENFEERNRDLALEYKKKRKAKKS